MQIHTRAMGSHLYSSQCFDGIQICCLNCRQQTENHADNGGEHHRDDDCRNADGHRDLGHGGDQLGKTDAGGGGTVAAPIFRAAAERFINGLNLTPSDPEAYEKYLASKEESGNLNK